MDLLVDSYLDSLGLPFATDQVKYLLCLLAAIPLGFSFRLLPNKPLVRQTYGLVWGLFLCVFCLGRFAWVHSLGTSLVAYAILRFGPAKYSHNIVFAWLMGYMSASHLYRVYTDYLGWHLDFTGPQMLLTQSLTALAFQLHDGRRLAKGEKLEDPYLVDKALTKLPGLYEYLSFVYFFPAFLAGPSHQFRDYQRLCDGTLFPNKRVPAGSTRALLVLLGKTLLCAPAFHLMNVIPVAYLATAEAATRPLLWKIAYSLVAFAIFRSRYYFAWFLSEAAFVATGEAYNGQDGEGRARWDRVTNVHALQVEFATNIREITSNWNISTANWLKYYVYFRLPSGPVATYGTYFVSAFWHGFYPGYYLFFLYAALLTETARQLRRHLRPLFLEPSTVGPDGREREGNAKWYKPAYDVVGIVLTMAFTDFGGTGFVLLSLEGTLAAFRNLNYMGFVVVPPVFAYFAFVHPVLFRKPRAKKE